MPFIHYKAIKSDGKIYKGSLNCENVAELNSYVKENGWRLIYWKKSRFKKFDYDLSLQDSINLFMHLGTMCKLKIPLLQAIHMLDTPSSNKKMVVFSKYISFCIQRGYLLSDILSTNFKKVDPTVISLIKTGEQTGKFALAFESIKNYFIWKKAYKEKIINAVRYPLICLAVVLSTFLFLILFLVPKVKPMLLQNQDYSLSLSTKFVFRVHEVLTQENNILLIGFFCFTLFIVSFLFVKLIKILKFQYDIFYKIPFFGSIFWRFFQENFFKNLSLQIESNKNLQDALVDIKNIFPSKVITSKINTLLNSLDNGYSLSLALQKLKFDPAVVQMVYLGEAEGSFETAFKNISHYLSEKSERLFNKFMAYLQPVLILIVSFVLIWVIYALFYPLYENIINMNL
tara:strand:- start:7954 stop:9153 length:1200 start_codon:yes stop_codon:yes gene_type:complete